METRVRLAGAAILLCIVFGAIGSALPVQAQIIPRGQQGCLNGSVVGGPNMIVNSDFSQGSVGFESDLPERAPQIYPSDPLGGYSIQTGAITYYNGEIVGRPFPGDPQREVAPSETYFYSNPNQDKLGNPGPFQGVLWRQTVTNLAPSTTYNFFGYFDNLLVPSINRAAPKIELRVDSIAAGPPVTVNSTPDTWMPVQFSFTTAPAQTSATLEIYDLANSIDGDDFGMTQIMLKQCVSGLGLAKHSEYPVTNGDGSYDIEYILTVRNLSADPLPLTNLQIRDNLAETFANAGSFQVVRIQSDTLTVNASFNGQTDLNLLSGTDSLPSRVNQRVYFTVRITAGASASGKGPFNNTAIASASAATIQVEDGSAPGLDPDPNGNGDPGDPLEDRPTPVWLDRFLLHAPLVRR
jgi:hypothetical protein